MTSFHILPPWFVLAPDAHGYYKVMILFNIHLHNRTSTLSEAALRGKECVIGNDYPPEDAAQAGTYNYLFITHPLKHKCTLLSHSASYFTHKPGNGLGF